MKKSYDTIIIGAGINGCAIANEISKNGKSVLIIEKGLVGCGTSSKSSRLIHGGLRYLEQFDFKLVKEALNNRRYLIKHYPQIVKLEPFYLPIYKNSPRPWWMIKVGLSIYDLLSGFEAPHKKIDREEFSTLFPQINTTDLLCAYRYFDGHTNDLKLTKIISDEAKKNGTAILENAKIDTINFDNEQFTINIAGDEIHTSTLINVSGAWIDEINQKYSLPSNFSIAKISGVHIILPYLAISNHLFLQTNDKRIFFMISDKGKTLIGTTERIETVNSDNIKINKEDIEYLINMSNQYLKKPISKDDILSSFIGTRPLIHSKKNPTQMSREYKLDLHKFGKNRLLHVFGGKLTTFHSLAQKVVATLN